MDPKQSLMLLFIMQKKKCIRKSFKKKPRFNYSASNCKIFLANFNSETRQAFSQMLNFQTGRRRYWMRQYNQLSFESVWDTREDDVTKELWKKEFRMSVETFQHLLDLIGINLQRLDTRFLKAIKVEKRLAIVVWRLSTGNSYRPVSKAFGVRKSTIIKIFQDGINLIVQLAPTLIKFPVIALETTFATTSFQEFTDYTIRQVVGAVGGTHIEI